MWGYCWHGVMMWDPRAPGPGLGWARSTMQPGVTLLHPHLQAQRGMTSLWSVVYMMLLEASLLGTWELCPGPSGSRSLLCLANLAAVSSYHG